MASLDTMKTTMKSTGLVLTVALGFLLAAAHAARWHGWLTALAWLAPGAFLFTRREFARRAGQLTLLAGTLVTLDSMVFFIRMRQAMGLGWMRLALILGLAALVSLLAAWALEHPLFARKPAKGGSTGGAGSGAGKDLSISPEAPQATNISGTPRPADSGHPLADSGAAGPVPGLSVPLRAASSRFAQAGSSSPWPGLTAWGLALSGLAMVQLKVPAPMLLAERFLPDAGWLEASLLAFYAGFVAEALLVPGRSPVVRRRIWSLFSLVFFGQLVLGLAGLPRFLMTGKLHLPVPALIVAGLLFREEGIFMLVLFGVTVLLAGPAWCSHLCYIGAWDSAMAGRRKRPGEAPAFLRRGRMVLAGLVFGSAFAMGRLGVPVSTAAWLAAGFGLCGVAVMALASRRSGVMVHCTGWCPMGLMAGLLGRLSPWRLRISEGCTACGACSAACRYDALRPEDLAARRPGISCSLCGDCLSRCPRSEMELTLFGRGGPLARVAFAALVAGLHAVFLGVARL